MIGEDQDALTCDLAETYGIYDMWSLPLHTVATLAAGLRDDSRIKLKMSGAKISTETLLLAGMFDRLSILIWQLNGLGGETSKKPDSILAQLMGMESGEHDKVEVFETGEDFDRRWKELTGSG